MKTSRSLLVCIFICIVPVAIIKAQCTGPITSTVITYDTSVVGVGKAPYIFTFPKFDATLGTLTSVRVQSVVSIQYSFTLENLDYSPRTLRHRFYRYDDITSPAVSFSHSSEYESPNYSFSMVPGFDDVRGSGPDVVVAGPLTVISADTLVNRTLFNTAAFMGPGNIAFNYATDGDVNLTSATGYFGSTTDIIKFNISYVYCSALILTSSTINLNVEKSGALSAMVKWTNSNESQAASYEVMVSSDGKNFTTAAMIPANGTFTNNIGSYQYKYEFNQPARTLYFRIKQINKDNKLEYTVIKPVSWQPREQTVHFIADQAGSSIYSNLPTAGGAAWNVDLFGVNGQLLQRNQLRATTNSTMVMKQKLQRGVYIIRAINNSTKEVITQKLLIQ
ncbi:choice-of-anchor E domain-containing protein [Flavitalea sp.]|nr:choice-of-anchor E domain-containing protein [Flavitalea sp.]